MKLRDFIEVYDFRELPKKDENFIEDTKVIRITVDKSTWFEFGCYDFNENNQFEKFINKNILDSEVEYINLVEEDELHYAILNVGIQNNLGVI